MYTYIYISHIFTYIYEIWFMMMVVVTRVKGGVFLFLFGCFLKRPIPTSPLRLEDHPLTEVVGPLPDGRTPWLMNGGDPNHLQVMGWSSKLFGGLKEFLGLSPAHPGYQWNVAPFIKLKRLFIQCELGWGGVLKRFHFDSFGLSPFPVLHLMTVFKDPRLKR